MKISSTTYFKLFANCKPVRGAKRSTICDLQRGLYFFIPNSCFDFIEQSILFPVESILNGFDYEDKQTAMTYIEYIIDNELGLLTENPEYFPEIDLNIHRPYIINDMIIELSDIVMTKINFIISEIIYTGVKFLEIRIDGTDLLIIKEFVELVKYTRIRSIDIIYKYNSILDIKYLKNVLCLFPIINNITIHSIDTSIELSPEENSKINLMHEKLSKYNCGQINERYFVPNLGFYLDAVQHNTCLNKKLSINSLGNYCSCPSIPNVYGSIFGETFTEAMTSTRYAQLSKIKKDDIETCKDCEFRYICSDCRAHLDDPYKKPFYCSYNPYTNKYD